MIVAGVLLLAAVLGGTFYQAQVATQATATAVAAVRATATTAAILQGVQDVQFSIAAAAEWQSTGIAVLAGQTLTVGYLSGRWMTCTTCGYDLDADGDLTIKSLDWPDNVLAGCQHGKPIGRIGDAPPVCIGKHFAGRASGSGMLALRINDRIIRDNGGSIVMRIDTGP